MDILYLVDRLENLIAGSRRMPLVNQIILKEAEILNIVDQLRTAIPDEVKLARRVIQDKERIIAQAQAEANILLTRAREESEQAIKREGLLQAAGIRSREIVRDAEENAQKLKAESDAYAAETLRALRDHLASIEVSVSRTILSIEKGLETLETPLDEADSEEVAACVEPVEEPYLPTLPVPRRAAQPGDLIESSSYPQESLANNTDRQFGHTLH